MGGLNWKRLPNWWCFGYCLFFWITASAETTTPQQFSYSVVVNGKDQGLINIRVTEDHDVWVERDDAISRWEMRSPLPLTAIVSSTGDVSLSSLQPAMQFHLDATQETLTVTISPEWIAPSEHVYTVRVNMVEKRDIMVLETGDHDVLILLEDWEKWHICPLPEKAILLQENGATYLSLNSLHPDVRFSIDRQRSTLKITINPSWFQDIQRVDFADRAAEDSFPIQANALTVTYHLLHTKQHDGNLFNLPVEMRMNVGKLLGESGVGYRRAADGATEITRMSSSITYDHLSSLHRYTVGDAQATSGELGGSVAIGGISLSKNFALSPYLVTSPQLRLTGLLETSSQISLYWEDMLICQENFAPGRFELLNVPVLAQNGDATMVIKDAYEQETTTPISFHRSSKLLKPGIQAYNYHLGLQRRHITEESFDYADLTFVGSHRIGISNVLTAGMHGEADRDVVNIGINATVLPMRRSEFESALAFSHDNNNGRSGYAAIAAYTYSNGRHFNANLMGRYFSPDYANLSCSNDEEHASRLALSINLTIQPPLVGSWAASWSLSDRYGAGSENTVMLSYYRTLWHNLSLNALFKRNEATDGTHYEHAVGIRFSPGRNRSSHIEYRNAKDSSMMSVRYGKNPSGRFGSGYEVVLDAQQNTPHVWARSGEASWQHYGQRGNYALTYRFHDEQQYVWNVSADGSVSWINHSWHFSPPLYESFAMVTVDGLSGIPIKLENQEIAKTDRNGEALISGLSAYSSNTLAVDVARLPFGVQMAEFEKSVVPSYKSGGIVTFAAQRGKEVEGRLFIVENDVKMPVENMPFIIMVDGEAKELFTASNGDFYIEYLPLGQYAATLLREEKQCHFMLNFPENEDLFIQLGDIEIQCESR